MIPGTICTKSTDMKNNKRLQLLNNKELPDTIAHVLAIYREEVMGMEECSQDMYTDIAMQIIQVLKQTEKDIIKMEKVDKKLDVKQRLLIELIEKMQEGTEPLAKWEEERNGK